MMMMFADDVVMRDRGRGKVGECRYGGEVGEIGAAGVKK